MELQIIPNPKFETENGYEICVKPVAVGTYKRFLFEWLQRNPMPKPPKRMVQYVDKFYPEDDPNNQQYLIEMQLWSVKKDQDEVVFLMSRGTIGDPPANWTPDEDTYSGELTPVLKKALWVLEHLHTEKDYEGLREAIISLNQVTAEGIAESEKK